MLEAEALARVHRLELTTRPAPIPPPALQHDLVMRARDGDGEAWETLYLRAYPRLVAFCHHRLGCVEDARDAVSETMTRAIAQIDRYRGEDHVFTAWLFGIARHVVADVHRRRARVRQTQALEGNGHEADPADDFIASTDTRIVRQAFARLPDDEAELLMLRVVGRLTSDEAAAALGKKPSAVRMAQKRALARLRTFVEEAQR